MMMEQWEGEEEGVLDHLKSGAQVWLSDTGVDGGGERFYAVNEAAREKHVSH